MDPSPPGCDLLAGDRRVAGVLGSTVWGGIAVDRTLEPPAESVVVDRGSEIRFEGEDPSPSEVFLWAYHRRDLPHPDRAAWEGPLDPGTPTWTADPEPGSYVLALFRAWEGRGDATHLFALEIRSS